MTTYEMTDTTTEFSADQYTGPRAPKLPGALRGLPGATLAQEAIQAEGRDDRVDARILAALAAATRAEDWALGEGASQLPEDWKGDLVPEDGAGRIRAYADTFTGALAVLLLWEECSGVGGPGGLAGHGTTRSVWARGLGSGRSNAGDGGAWDSAFEAAYRVSLETLVGFQVHPEGRETGARARVVMGASHAEALAARIVLLLAGEQVPGRGDVPAPALAGEPEDWRPFLQGLLAA